MATRYYVAAFHTHANVRAWLIDPGFIFLRGDENLAIPTGCSYTCVFIFIVSGDEFCYNRCLKSGQCMHAGAL